MIHKKGKRRELPPLFLHFEQLYQKRKNGRDGDFRRPSHILHEHDCKPGSVFDSHLSTRRVAAVLQPPRERSGQPIAPIPVLLRIEFTASDTLEPTGALLPHLSTFSRSTLPFPACTSALRYVGREVADPERQSAQVVYFCCTFPQIALGGRYPLSLPCGARTFLTTSLSASPRDCLSYSHKYFIPWHGACQRKMHCYFFVPVLY